MAVLLHSMQIVAAKRKNMAVLVIQVIVIRCAVIVILPRLPDLLAGSVLILMGCIVCQALWSCAPFTVGILLVCTCIVGTQEYPAYFNGESRLKIPRLGGGLRLKNGGKRMVNVLMEL